MFFPDETLNSNRKGIHYFIYLFFFLPDSVGQLLILDLRAEEVRVGRLVAHGGGERAEDGVQQFEDLVLVDAVPALAGRLAQRALHGHQQRGDVDEAAHLAEDGARAVALAQHRQQGLRRTAGCVKSSLKQGFYTTLLFIFIL